MGKKRYDSYSDMHRGGGKSKVPPSQTDTSKFAGGYVPDASFSGRGANVKGTRLPGAGMIRKSMRGK